MNKPKILIVDSDILLSITVKSSLISQGYDVTIKRDGIEGLAEAHSLDYLVVILENNLPGINGIEICKRLRRREIETPIILLSSHSETNSIVAAFKAGADDYLTKPLSIQELSARIYALVSRPPRSRQKEIMAAGLKICKRNQYITDENGRRIYLRRKELQILTLLAEYKGQTLSRARICNCTSSSAHSPSREAVDVHVSNLRKVLKGVIKGKIETVYGIGYRLKEDS